MRKKPQFSMSDDYIGGKELAAASMKSNNCLLHLLNNFYNLQ